MDYLRIALFVVVLLVGGDMILSSVHKIQEGDNGIFGVVRLVGMILFMLAAIVTQICGIISRFSAKERALSSYDRLVRYVRVERFDELLMVVACLLFVVCIMSVWALSEGPNSQGDDRSWTMALFGMVLAGVVTAIAVNLSMNRAIIEELERLKAGESQSTDALQEKAESPIITP